MAFGKKISFAKGDLVILVVLLVVGLAFLGFFHWQSLHAAEGADLVVTDTATNNEMIYNLGKDIQFEVEGALGTSTIEIRDGKARFVASPCPDQICVHVFGWIEKEGQLSFCLPNQVLLEVRQ